MATEKAVIELVVDPSGLKPGYDALKALGALDAQQQEAFTKANAEFQASQAKTTVTVQNTAKAIQQIPKQIFSEAVKKNNEDIQKSIKQVGTEMMGLGSKSVSLRQQIKQNTQALAEMELSGKRTTQAYADLLAETGELKDAMADTSLAIKNAGSDTKNIEGVIGIARGVTAAYNLAAAGASIFGNENKDLQASLLKTQVAMQLLLSVQELGNLVQKESIAVQFIANGQKKINVAITALETATESQYVAVQWLAIEAQIALNAAMRANPVALLVGAFAALVGIMFSYDKVVNGAANDQIALNAVEEKSIELSKEKAAALDHETEAIKQRNDATVKELELQNAGLEAINAQEKKAFDERNAINQKFYDETKKNLFESLKAKGVYVDASMSLEELRSAAEAKVIQGDTKLRDDAEEKRAGSLRRGVGLSDMIAAKIRSVYSGMTSAQKEALEGEAKVLQGQIELADKALTQTNALGQEEIEQDKKKQLLLLNNAKARFELISLQELEASRKLSEKRLQAEKALIETQRQLDIDGANLTREQIQLINEKAIEAKKQLESKYTIDRLNDVRKGIDAELQLTTQGSQRQLALKLLDLSTSEQAELAVLHLNANEKLDIEAKYLKQRQDLQIEYNMQAQLRQLASERVMIDARIKLEADGDRDILEDRLQIISIEAREAQAKNQAAFDERKISAKQYQDEETRIEYKGINDRLEAERDFKDKLIELDRADTNAEAEHQKAVVNLRKNGLYTGIFAKQQAAQEEFTIEENRLEAEKKSNIDFYKDKANRQDEFARKQEALNDQINANKQAKDLQAFHFGADLANQAMQQTVKFAQMAVQAWQEANDAYYAQRIATLEKAMNAELSLDNTSNVQKAAIRNKYLKEERELKLKAWKADQQAKELSAIMNTALGITSALATSGNIYAGIALAALVAATGAVEIGIISSAKPPAFAEGVVNFQGKGTGTSDSNMALISHGESVITADATNRYAPYLEMMNAGMEIPQFSAPTVSSEVMNTFVNHMPEFDYNKFGEIVADKLKQNPQFHLTLDQHGYNVHVQKGIHRTQELNNRISTK